jgi:hypothetical protein
MGRSLLHLNFSTFSALLGLDVAYIFLVDHTGCSVS